MPGVYQPGSVKRRRGEQSEQGNPHLKWAFNQAAMHAVRHYAAPRRCFDKHLGSHAGPAGKVIAYNKVAHKLAVAAFHTMRDGVAHQEERLFGTAQVGASERKPASFSGPKPVLRLGRAPAPLLLVPHTALADIRSDTGSALQVPIPSQ